MTKRSISHILVLIVILSFLLRIYSLDSESLWLDESVSVDISKGSILEIIYTINTDPHPPLYYVVLHFWMKLFGDSELSIRFPSVIFGILSIYVIFKLGELIFDYRVGLLSSFILSISMYHIRYSQEARSYSLLILLVLLSNYYFIRFLENKERKYIIVYIIFSIMMIYTHIYGLFYLASQSIYYLILQRRDIKLWMIIQGIILSFFVLSLPLLFRKVARTIEGNFIMSNSRELPTFDSIYETFKIFVGNEQILYIFITVIMIGLTIKEYKKDRYIYIFMTLWLFLPILISFVISYTIGYLYMNRYFMASFPTLILLFSKGLSNIKNISIILSVLIIIIVLQIPLIERYYHDIQKDQWRETTNFIKDTKKNNDIILLYPDFTKIPFGYYYKNSSDYIGINISYDTNNIVKNHDRVWLIFSHMGYQERKKELELIRKELSKTYINEDTTQFIGIKINLYEKID